MLKGWLNKHWQETQAVSDNLKARTQRYNQLYQAGGGSISDFLYADFGSESIGSLDIKPWASQTVKIESLFNSPIYKNSNFAKKIKYLNLAGGAPWISSNTININPLWFSSLGMKLRAPFGMLIGKKPASIKDVVPHEFIHRCQHYSDHSGWERIAGNHIGLVGMDELSLPRKLRRKAARVFCDVNAGTASGYFAENVEIQARMHEILAQGYAQWQKMPTNKTELWAALINLGLMAPEAVQEELKGTEKGERALDEFKVIRTIKSAVSNRVTTFNHVHTYAGESDSQKALWVSIYPMLYGELIEFYGDKLGRERMGMGTNPRPAIEVLHELKDHYKTPIPNEKVQEMAARIPPAVAAAFLNVIISKYPEDEKNFDNAMAISEVLLERQEVKDVMFANNQLAIDFSGHSDQPPLHTALDKGHFGMTKLLTESGASPFQTYTMYDMRMKPLYTGSPLDCAKDIVISESYLTDPSQLQGKERRYYEDSKNREREEWQIGNKRVALQLMLDLYDQPDEMQELYVFGSDPEDVSLRDVLARIGITRNENVRSLENELEVT